MVNQICIAGLVQGLAEGIHFSEKAGLDIANVMEVISKGAAQSWQMENRWESMSQDFYDHGFAVDHMRKDLKIAIEEAKENNAKIEITEIIDNYYKDIQDMGGNRWDTSSLLKRLQ
jgi:3-hydroxyisobutyrate dehydrogenase-like beta-hydroxyacid dehydrogenase